MKFQMHYRTPTGEPEEIAQVVLLLACDRSSFMTGTVTAMDAGSSWH